MKRLLVAFAVTGALFSAAPALPQNGASADEAEMVDARAIIAIMLPPASRDATMHTLMSQISQQAMGGGALDEIKDPGMRAIVKRYLDEMPTRLMPVLKDYIPKLLEATAVAYSHEFDAEELKAMRRFAETPAGAHYLSRSTALVGDPAVAAVNSQLFAEANKVSIAMRDEMIAELHAYAKEHPTATISAKPATGS